VFPDADLEKAAGAVASEIFFKTGQYCAAGTRLFVHERAFDPVVEAIAERARAKGVEKVVFDRGGYQYHGRVQALAEAAREAGLKF